MAGKRREEEEEEEDESEPGDIQSAGADVTEASQKRKWLQKRGIEETGCGSRGSPRWSQAPSCGAVQIPRGQEE